MVKRPKSQPRLSFAALKNDVLKKQMSSFQSGLQTPDSTSGKNRYKLGLKNPSKNINEVEIGSYLHETSLIRAARDGMIEILEDHLQTNWCKINDIDEDGLAAIHYAARYNRVKIIELLIDAGAKENLNGGVEQCTALHMACRYNSQNAVQYLLGCGSEVNCTDVKGRTPLHYATRRGHDTIAKMLLSVTSCNVDAADVDGSTPLHMAAIQGGAAIVETLVSRGACVTARDINDMTPLMWATIEGHVDAMQYLIKTGLKMAEGLQYVRAHDNEGNTALHLAVQNGQFEAAKLLIEHRSDVNAQKNNLVTPLHIAAMYGFDEIAELLIASDSEVNKQDSDQMTPMHRAALYNKVTIMEILLRHGAEIDSKDKNNKQPLHCASWKGQTESVEFLIERDAAIGVFDNSLMTPLHWATKCSQHNTLTILLKHSTESIINAVDKSEQTALHYAARTGHHNVLNLLLDYGARTDAKDHDERSPLHIAAMNGNDSCVETLIDSSSHEINDDDVDGRTPLLLGSFYGHSSVVQVLLSLGAEISSKDVEHRTSMMLAATQGHTSVMKILRDNHAAVNEVDKMKNTALHYACGEGHVESVSMLLEQKACVSVKNSCNQTPMDLAIDNLNNDVAVTLLKSSSWKECLSVRDSHGFNCLDRLIARLPEATLVLLDHCVEKSSRDDEDMNLTMMFDYSYIDPGPDDKASQRKRYFALNAMVTHGRDGLLSHPLCQNILSQKWVRFGRTMFILNLIMYFTYLTTLTIYTFSMSGRLSMVPNSAATLCPMMRINESVNGEYKLVEHRGTTHIRIQEKKLFILSILLFAMTVLFGFREILKLSLQRSKYIFNPYSWISCSMVAVTLSFVYPIGHYPCILQWRAGWMANFIAWINLLMYIRKIDFLGIYVIMFVTVLSSLVKAILVYFFFCWAFASAFFIITAGRHVGFKNLSSAILSTFVMTMGEMDYTDNFITGVNFFPFGIDVTVLLGLFVFLMPIVMMNLTIGVAVGDIDKIQKNAYIKRIALQIDLLYNTENFLPRALQRKLYVRKAVIKPNVQYHWYTKIRRFVFGSSMSLQFIDAEKKDKVSTAIDRLEREIHNHEQKLRSIQANITQQTALLLEINSKLTFDNKGVLSETASMYYTPETISVYEDNKRRLSVASSVGSRHRGSVESLNMRRRPRDPNFLGLGS